MANIDYFGNVIRVTGAGTLGMNDVFIESMYIWTANSNSLLVVTDVNSGSAAQVMVYATDVTIPTTDTPYIAGRFGKLSFDTVTACTAWIVKR